jgi:hypothetical protein
MRFAWQIKNRRLGEPPKRSFSHPLNLTMIVYNIIWWIPLVLALTRAIGYETAFIAFFAVTAGRLVANLVRNNVLRPEAAIAFPLRYG